MIIGGLQKLSLIDYPDKLACTVFCIGCNFRCPFCYNPELVLPTKIKSWPKISEKEFFEFLIKRKALLQGVCIGGGEPTINKDLPEFVKKIKKIGYLVKLDTNGSNPEMIGKLIDAQLVDYIAMDVKAPPTKYAEATGIDSYMAFNDMRLDFWQQRIIENIEKSIELLKQGKIDYEFRTTIVPNLLTKKDILAIAEWIGAADSIDLDQSVKYFLQNFKSGKTIDPKFAKLKPCPETRLVSMQKAVAPFLRNCQIRA